MRTPIDHDTTDLRSFRDCYHDVVNYENDATVARMHADMKRLVSCDW